jgi:anti-anti-sigma regulatory factor
LLQRWIGESNATSRLNSIACNDSHLGFQDGTAGAIQSGITSFGGWKMATPAYCFTTLQFSMDEKPEEITIHCNGRITADSAYMFQREVCGHSIPVSRGKGLSVINRIVLDLSNVTHIDNVGLEALLNVWTAGQRKACNVEIINFGPQAFKRATLSRLNQAFRKMLALFE